MTGAPDQGQFPVIQEGLQHAPQGQLLGLSVHKGQQDGAEIALQRGASLQILQHRVWIGVTAQFHHDTHAFTVAFIADIRDAADLAVVDLFRQLFDPAGLAELVGQFRDDHCLALVSSLARLHFLDVCHTPHRDAAASFQVGVEHTAAQQHFTTRGEVRSGNQAEQLFIGEVRLAHQGDQAIHHLAEVVGRNAGGHADGDARATVQQQKRKLSRQDGGFLLRTVEVGCEINGVVADFIQQPFVGDRRQSRLGVSHRGRWIVVHGAEVAVTIEQWMPTGEGLHQPHQGVVHGLITMGVVLTKHVADDTGTFAVGPIWRQSQLMHRVEDASLNRFEPIADIR